MPEGFSQGSAEETSGTIRTGQESRAVFENTYRQTGPEPPEPYNPPKTGDSADLPQWFGMILPGMAAIGTMAFREPRKRK